MQEGDWKPEGKQPGALPRDGVTQGPVCGSKAPRDSSAAPVTGPLSGLTGFRRD